MSWAKIDDRLCLHPKFISISLEAAGLWVRALSYAAGLERDGWFPVEVLPLLAGTHEYDVLVHELVHAMLWVREPDGYRFHDYLRFNLSRKQLVRQRKKTTERVTALRVRNAVTNAVSTPVVTRLPARPVPSGSGREEQKKLAFARKEKPPRAKAKTPWPEDLVLTEALAAYATRQGLDARYEWGKFQAHALRDDVRHVDWPRAWEYWVRNAWEIAQRHT
jgi:hypothetical protein